MMAVCGTGFGSSFMVEMNIKTVLNDLGVTGVEVEHSDLGAATHGSADVFVAGRDIAMAMGHLENVLVLDNLLDKNELKEKLVAVLKERNLM